MIYSILLIMGCICIASSYRIVPMLSETHMTTIRKVFSSNDENMKKTIKAIVAQHYTPWVKRVCGDFALKHRVMGDKVLVDELHQAGFLGFMESLENYNGAVKIPYYSEKYIHGRLCKVMKLRGQLRKCEFVSYAERWKLENHDGAKNSDEIMIAKIKAIMMNAPTEYRQWFFAKYDCETLLPRRSTMSACNRMNCSDETYRRKMKKIYEYVKDNMTTYEG